MVEITIAELLASNTWPVKRNRKTGHELGHVFGLNDWATVIALAYESGGTLEPTAWQELRDYIEDPNHRTLLIKELSDLGYAKEFGLDDACLTACR